jgi:predicted transcriptional regulator
MTLDELAERLNLSRSFITKAIKELTAIDAITRKRGEPVKGYWSPASMVTTINKAYF